MLRRTLALLAALLLEVSPAAAQFRADSSRADARRLAGDVWALETAALRARPRDLGVAAAAGASIAAVAVLDRPIYAWLNGNPDAFVVRLLRPIREEARFPLYELGSGQYLLPLSGALYVSGLASRSRRLREAGLGCATAHLTSAVARDLVYLLVARDRPRVSPGDASRIAIPGAFTNWDRHSFFSGHIANSMGCASFFSHHGDLGPVVAPVAYTFVTAIGAGRVADGRHWASDTMIGALFGYAVGKAVAERMAARHSASVARTGLPVALSWRVEF